MGKQGASRRCLKAIPVLPGFRVPVTTRDTGSLQDDNLQVIRFGETSMAASGRSKPRDVTAKKELPRSLMARLAKLAREHTEGRDAGKRRRKA